ncbi:MAG: ABC-2 transporter permease [Clostridium sp.]|nr:ABC-2 transporter permease [Clostridium sp.]
MDINNITLTEVNSTIFIVGIFTIAIVIPIALVAGFNKTRIILIVLALFPVCFSKDILETVPKIGINNISDSTFTLIVYAGGILLTVISYFITSVLYAHKDIN